MRTIAISFLILLFNLSLNAQQLQEKEVITYCNSTLMEKILGELEIEYQSQSANSYSIVLNEFNVVMTIEQGDLHLTCFFEVEKASLNRINDYNSEIRWGRAYIDADGDVVLESELSFTGGIGIEGINTFLATYEELTRKLSVQFE